MEAVRGILCWRGCLVRSAPRLWEVCGCFVGSSVLNWLPQTCLPKATRDGRNKVESQNSHHYMHPSGPMSIRHVRRGVGQPASEETCVISVANSMFGFLLFCFLIPIHMAVCPAGALLTPHKFKSLVIGGDSPVWWVLHAYPLKMFLLYFFHRGLPLRFQLAQVDPSPPAL